MELITWKDTQTKLEASNFAQKLKGGEVIALYGELGSGKTTFVQGLASGLGLKERILSPTFILHRSYKIKDNLTFHHLDLYRLENQEEVKKLDFMEILGQKEAIVAIEWPEKIEKFLPPKVIKIYFENLGKEKRSIKING